MLKVLLVEDSELVRERLIQVIESIPNLTVAGQYEDADSASSAVESLIPDIILLDIRLRAGSGINVLKHTRRVSPHTKVIVLTNYAEPQYRKTCLENGAHYFLDKSIEFDKVPGLLLQLADGR